LRVLAQSAGDTDDWIGIDRLKALFDGLRHSDHAWRDPKPVPYDDALTGSSGLLRQLEEFGWVKRDLGASRPGLPGGPADDSSQRAVTNPTAARLTRKGRDVLMAVDW